MFDTGSAAARHRVLDALAELRALEATADGQTLIDGLKFHALLRRQSEHDTLRTIAQLDREGEFSARNVSAAPAVADIARCTPAKAHRLVAVARSVFPTTLDGRPVEPKLPATATALGAWEIDLSHAEVIEKALSSDAAGRLDAEVWRVAEKQLAEWARLHRPDELAKLAGGLIEQLDQDGPAPEDSDDYQVNELTLSKSRDGIGGRVKARLDSETFDMLARAIEASVTSAADEDRTLSQRRADALAEICAHALDEGRLPVNGGERPHLTVTVSEHDLRRGLRGATLDIGGRISGAALRRLACDSAVIAVMLGGDDQPLDVGREQRTATKYQRRALAVRDGGCAFPGCGKPPHRSEVHHIKHWIDHGRTDLDNLVILCLTHHRMVHRSGWQVHMVEGIPEFVPPKWLDITQTPRRKSPPTATLTHRLAMTYKDEYMRGAQASRVRRA